MSDYKTIEKRSLRNGLVVSLEVAPDPDGRGLYLAAMHVSLNGRDLAGDCIVFNPLEETAEEVSRKYFNAPDLVRSARALCN